MNRRWMGNVKGWMGHWVVLGLVGCGEGFAPSEPSRPPVSQTQTSSPPSQPVMDFEPDHRPRPTGLWQVPASEFLSVATDADGNVYTVSHDFDVPASGPSPRTPPLALVRFDPDGHFVWRESWSPPGGDSGVGMHSLTVSPQGFISIAYESPAGVILMQVSPQGELKWVRALSHAATCLGVATNSAGEVFVLWVQDGTMNGWSYVSHYQADGTPRSSWPTPASSLAFAIDPEGNLLLGTLGAWDRGPGLMKVTPQGAPLWQRSFGPGPMGVVRAVGAATDGTAVAMGYFEPQQGGTDAVAGSGPRGERLFLAVVQANRQPLVWVPPVQYENRAQLAVDASGELVLATPVPGRSNQVALDKYNLSGELLWHRQMGDPDHAGKSGTTVEYSAASAPNHHTLISSTRFTGPDTFDASSLFDFQEDSAVFLLDVQP